MYDGLLNLMMQLLLFLLMNQFLFFLPNNFLFLLMDNGLMDLVNVLLLDDWLVDFMDDWLVDIGDLVLVMLYYHILMVFMQHILMLLLYNWSLHVFFYYRGRNLLLDYGLFDNLLHLDWLNMFHNNSRILLGLNNRSLHLCLTAALVIHLTAVLASQNRLLA